MRKFFVLLLVVLSTLTSTPAATSSFSSDQLHQLVAPIALYPDSLLMQVMMASAYPVEVVDADRWVKANPNMSDAERQQQLATKTWDPSVSSLTAFPDVLARMSSNLDWTEALGEAFVGQQKDLLAAVQDLRAKASAAGTLQSTPQATVANSGGVIAISPPDDSMVYVPSYDPTSIYGTWGYGSSYYWPGVMGAPVGWTAGRPLAFASGVAVGSAMFGGVNWGTSSVYVNRNLYNYSGYRTGVNNSVYRSNVNTSVNRTNWQYDNAHRQGTNFQNPNLQNRYGKSTMATTPQELRGYGAPGATYKPGTAANAAARTNAVTQAKNPMPGSRSIPYTAPAASSNAMVGRQQPQTGFGSYNSASAANRASARGAASTGRAGAGFNNVPRNAPTRSVNFGGGGFRGGRR